MSDFPSLSSIETPTWTRDYICQDDAVFDPALNDPTAVSEALTQPVSPTNISSPPTFQRPATGPSHGGGSVHQNTAYSPGGGLQTLNVDSSPGGGSPVQSKTVPTADPVSAGERNKFQNRRRSKGCKRLRFCDKVPPVGMAPRHWRDCESKNMTNVMDAELAEYLIGFAIEIAIPESFWPRDKGQWVISCTDIHTAEAPKDTAKGFKKG